MHSQRMNQMLVTGLLCALVAIVCSTPVPVSPTDQSQQSMSMPCDHFLRLVVPSLFTHCATTCYYSDWGSWQIVQSHVPINKTVCPSQYYFVQQRTKKVISVIGNSTDCIEPNETRKICEFLMTSIKAS